MVVLHPFSGSGVCKQAFLDAGYTHVLESDTVTSRNMGPCVDDVQLPEEYDVSTTAHDVSMTCTTEMINSSSPADLCHERREQNL